MKKILVTFFVLFAFQFQAQQKLPLISVKDPLEQEANTKIGEVEKLIVEAKKKKIDVTKELTSIYIAKMFLQYAKWDEDNIDVNTELFKQVRIHRKNAAEVAEKLPRVERKDVIKLLDNCKKELGDVLIGRKKRQTSKKVDWSLVKVDQDRLTIEDQTVFLSDFMFKPEDDTLKDFFGNKDVYNVSPFNLEQEGLVEQSVIDDLENRKETTLGVVNIDQSKMPFWANQTKDLSKNIKTSIFSSFDIDNPSTRDIYKKLLLEIVPYTTGKKYADLGYALSDNPYVTTVDDSNLLKSTYTKENFKKWLINKHRNISVLNSAWNTTYSSFGFLDNISVNVISTKGSPAYYDWTTFKMDRNTEWFKFLKYRIQKDNPLAKAHLKVTPNFWLEGNRNHGVDLEALTELSGIIGTATGADHIRIFGKPLKWEKRYKYDWIEACMSYDFMKSINPDSFIYNSESHFLSNRKSRDLYLDPLFSRSILWLAHIHGMSVSNNWYWPRGIDGEVNMDIYPEEYACTNGQQALVTNEFAMTMMDINSNAEDILAFQREEKPVRIFYSKTTAIHKENYMDSIFNLYEQFKFNGFSIGFATKNIIENHKKSNWDVIAVKDTEYISNKEFEVLQEYLNNGGYVILDEVSLKYNEYKKPLGKTLVPGKGRIIKANTLDVFEDKIFAVMSLKNKLPIVSIIEKNENGEKGCLWNVVKNKEGEYLLSVVNVGNTVADLEILYDLSKSTCIDIINDIEIDNKPVLGPYEVLFLKVEKK